MTPTDTFQTHRPRLFALAYRLLGSRSDAEDIVQDAWLRWHEAAKDTFDSAEAWLVTVVTRLSIDRLRAAKIQREHYTGAWMPEPVLTGASGAPETPEALLERADKRARAKDSRIVRVDASLSEEIREVLIASSDGRFVFDRQPLLRFGVRVIAEQDKKRQSGSSGGGDRPAA